MPYYQPIIDIINSNLPREKLDLALEFCKEVEREVNAKKIQELVDKIVTQSFNTSPEALIPDQVWHESMARVMQLEGMRKVLMQLVEWYEPLFHANQRVAANWGYLLEFITLPEGKQKSGDLDEQSKRYVRALSCLIQNLAAAVGERGVVAPRFAFGEHAGPQPLSTILAEGIQKVFPYWMTIYQRLLDETIGRLGEHPAGKNENLRKLEKRLKDDLSITFRHSSFSSKALISLIVELTKIVTNVRSKHTYLDYFGEESRVFWFNTYDRDGGEPFPKLDTIKNVILYRERQITFLIDAFGESQRNLSLPKAQSDALVARQLLINTIRKKMTNFRLETEDALAPFGAEFLKTHLDVSKDAKESWFTLVAFVRNYLATHTFHAEYNLAEKPAYFGRQFPRALNGGSLMDCGTYAVLLSYLFLYWANSFQAKAPKVIFVVLPVHVGLVIYIDGFDTMVIHNATIWTLSAQVVENLRLSWDSKPEDSDPQDEARKESKFWQDVAAQLFISDVDIPVKEVGLPASKSPQTKKEDIWKIYTDKVVPGVESLFRSKVVANSEHDLFSFDTRILAVTELEKRWQRQVVVPFWNECCYCVWQAYLPKRQQEDERRLKETIELWKRSIKISPEETPNKLRAVALRFMYAKKTRDDYITTIKELLKIVDNSYEKDLRPDKRKYTEELRSNAKVVLGTGVRLSSAERLSGLANELGPIGYVRQHVIEAESSPGDISAPAFASLTNYLYLD